MHSTEVHDKIVPFTAFTHCAVDTVIHFNTALNYVHTRSQLSLSAFSVMLPLTVTSQGHFIDICFM